MPKALHSVPPLPSAPSTCRMIALMEDGESVANEEGYAAGRSEPTTPSPPDLLKNIDDSNEQAPAIEALLQPLTAEAPPACPKF